MHLPTTLLFAAVAATVSAAGSTYNDLYSSNAKKEHKGHKHKHSKLPDYQTTEQCSAGYEEERRNGCKPKYDVGKLLGHGFFGNVFLATHKQTGEKVALKCVRRGNPKMLIREYCKMRNARNENILEAKELTCYKDSPCIALELASDGSLASFAEKHYKDNNGRLPEDVARPMFKAWAEGIAYMHSIGMANRDIKPENVLMVNGKGKVCDLGIACWSTEKGPHPYNCHKNSLMGTPGYKSEDPIMLLHWHPDIRPRDVYALGMSFRQLVTGQKANGWCFMKHKVRLPHHNIGHDDYCNFTPEFIDLIKQMTNPYYKHRPTMKQVLQHPWMQGTKFEASYKLPEDHCDAILKCPKPGHWYNDDWAQYLPEGVNKKDAIPIAPIAPKELRLYTDRIVQEHQDYLAGKPNESLSPELLRKGRDNLKPVNSAPSSSSESSSS